MVPGGWRTEENTPGAVGLSGPLPCMVAADSEETLTLTVRCHYYHNMTSLRSQCKHVSIYVFFFSKCFPLGCELGIILLH